MRKAVSGPSRGLGSFLLKSARHTLMKLTQSFRPVSRPGEFPTKRGKREYETRKEFPSPREAWVVSYTFQTLKSYKCHTVSGPSRGLGGVLPNVPNKLESQ